MWKLATTYLLVTCRCLLQERSVITIDYLHLGRAMKVTTHFFCLISQKVSFRVMCKSNLAVVASMPGFQSKRTRVVVEDEVTSLDFILIPEGEDSVKQDEILNNYICSCGGKDKLELVEFLRGTHFEIYLFIFIVVVFLFYLLKRKKMFKFLKHRQFLTHRRHVVI